MKIIWREEDLKEQDKAKTKCEKNLKPVKQGKNQHTNVWKGSIKKVSIINNLFWILLKEIKI